MKHPTDYTKGNETAARIILETPEQFGAGMVAWARKVLKLDENSSISAPPCDCGSLPDGVVPPEMSQ
jgi:hypothetical protein